MARFRDTATFVLATLAMLLPAQAQSPAPGLLARGDYLVNTVLTCGNCHSPKGPPQAIAGKEFSGGIRFDEAPFDVWGANITPDKETGIGTWSAADIRKALRTGVRPNGVPLAAIMPTAFYGIMTERDMDAVVAYLQSLKPVKNKVADPVYKIALPQVPFPGAEKPMSESALADKAARGFYLGTIAHCMECHTPMGAKGRDYAGRLGAGGFEFKGPWGVSVSRNITASKVKGLGGWTDDEIKRAITEGISRDGTPLKPPMGYPLYARMTPEDLDAIVAWLRTLPAQE